MIVRAIFHNIRYPLNNVYISNFTARLRVFLRTFKMYKATLISASWGLLQLRNIRRFKDLGD